MKPSPLKRLKLIASTNTNPMSNSLVLYNSKGEKPERMTQLTKHVTTT